jgi:hypothetical protein
LIFQNLSPLKYVYLKIYNTFFGSVCFYTFLTRNLSSPTDLPLYSPHLHTSMFFPRNLEILSTETLTSIFEPLKFIICLRHRNESCRSHRDASIPTNLISFRPP